MDGTPRANEILAWPVTVDLRTAGRAFGVGRDQAYRLARENRFPVPVLRLGRRLRVTRASVMAALGIDDEAPTAVRTASAGEVEHIPRRVLDERSR